MAADSLPNHPSRLDPREFAQYSPDKMGKATIFKSDQMLVGLNAFEPGQEHKLHAHAGMDKLYSVIEGEEIPMAAGDLLVAPADIPHGIRNSSGARLLVLAVLAPSP